jgi:hypothetical protein
MEELLHRIARLEKENDKKHRYEDQILKLENVNEHLRATVRHLCLICPSSLPRSVKG